MCVSVFIILFCCLLQQEAYENDQLIYHGALKARISSLLLDGIDAVVPRLGEISLPVLTRALLALIRLTRYVSTNTVDLGIRQAHKDLIWSDSSHTVIQRLV